MYIMATDAVSFDLQTTSQRKEDDLQLELCSSIYDELAVAQPESCLHLCGYVMSVVYVKLDLPSVDQFHLREFSNLF